MILCCVIFDWHSSLVKLHPSIACEWGENSDFIIQSTTKINSMKMTLSLSFAIGIVQLHSENSIWHFGWLHLKTVVIYISIYNQPNHCLHIIWNHIILLTIWISATGEERNFIAFFGFYQGGFMKYSGFSLILVRLCVISVRSSIPG